MKIRLILAIALLSSALGGCASESGGPEGGSDDALSAPGTAQTTDCGAFVVAQREDLSEEAAGCLIDAVNGRRPAVLKVTWPTVEGDPIPTTYGADAGGSVEVTIDTRADNFGPKAIWRETCTGPRLENGLLQFGHCSQLSPVPS